MKQILCNLGVEISQLELPNQHREDSRVWRQSTDGLFTVGSAYEVIRERANALPWTKFLWTAEVLPRTLGTGWKVLHGAMHTNEKLRGKNFKMVSRCCICTVAEETQDHILFECSFAQRCWELIAHNMQHHTRIANREEMFIKCRNESPLLQDLWKAASISCLVAVIYGNKKSSISSVMSQVRRAVNRANDRSKKHMHNTTRDLEVLKAWKLPPKLRKAPCTLECYWVAPPSNMIKVNADGCSRGNPKNSGWGTLLRDSNGNVIGAYIGGLGIATNFIAESFAIVEGISKAAELGWKLILVEFDSTAAVKSFQNDQVHWQIRAALDKVKELADWIIVTNRIEGG
ncbi:hypothetical protein IFM89_033222 [Coptis chinensis]|uniref:RNase H type-1 domain-containing protein n=1 Tax=Coptis chinensis TaxID=261450 RepID=A0A835IZK8_9MAGN|nr:hypothetical protein IFM89_033222 [Coptis chinensis]